MKPIRTIRAIQEDLDQVKFKLQQTTKSIQEFEAKQSELLEVQSKETMATDMDERLERIQQITNVRQEIQRLQHNIVDVVTSKNELEDEFTGMVLELINERDKVEVAFYKQIDEAKKTHKALQEQLNALATNQKEIRDISNKAEALLFKVLGPSKAKEVHASIRNIDNRTLANEVRKLFVSEAVPINGRDGAWDVIR